MSEFEVIPMKHETTQKHIELQSNSDFLSESEDKYIHPLALKHATVGSMFYLGFHVEKNNEIKTAYMIQNITSDANGTPTMYQCVKIDADTSSPNIIFLKEEELRDTEPISGLQALQLMDSYHNYVIANKDALLLLRRKKLGFCFSTKNGPIYYVADIPDIDTFICKLSNRNGYNASNDAYPSKVILNFHEIDNLHTYNFNTKIDFGKDIYSLYASYYFDLKTPSRCLLIAVIVMFCLQLASLFTIVWCFDVAYEQSIIKVYEQSISPYTCRNNQFALDILCGDDVQLMNITDSGNISCNQRIISQLTHETVGVYMFTVNIPEHEDNATFTTCNQYDVSQSLYWIISVLDANGNELAWAEDACWRSTVTNVPSGTYRVAISPESDIYPMCYLSSYSEAHDTYSVVAMIEKPADTQSFAERQSWDYLSGYPMTCIVSVAILTVYVMKDMMCPIKLILACAYMDLMSVSSKIKIYALSMCLVVLILFAYGIGAWIIASSAYYVGLSQPFEVLALPIGIVFVLELDNWFYEALRMWHTNYEGSHSHIQVSKLALEDFKNKSWKLFICLLVIQFVLSSSIMIGAFLSLEQRMSHDVYISNDAYHVTLWTVLILGSFSVAFVVSVIGSYLCLSIECNDDRKICPCF